MLKIGNIRILYKILACFALLGAVVAGAVLFAASNMEAKDKAYSNIIDNEVAALAAGLRANQRAFNFEQLFWREIAEPNLAEKKKIAEEVAANEKELDSFFDEAKKHAVKYAARYEKAHQIATQIYHDYEALEKATLANNNAEALRIARNLVPRTTTSRRDISIINGDLNSEMQVKNNQESAHTEYVIVLTTASISTALAIVLVLAFLLVQYGVAKPVGSVVEEMKKLAAGDFNVALPWVGRKDEVGQIADAVQMVVDRVGSTVGNIKVAANEVTSASAEISTSTTDLSQRTEEQAASLEETSASMEEISATVKKNADSARQANEFATETTSVAERGGAVVSDAVTAMARIEESSRKIADIIGVIDEIARQTNLLALNAAVEAARAGEAGRGFAVVASEVRTLAQRSSQAAKDIKDLIISSNSQVKDGVDLVNKAGESLSEIVASIKKVAGIVGDIANASLEQSAGVEQINKALAQMDEVTQQNSALVEENAATAKTLEQQAQVMDEQVAYFKIGGGEILKVASNKRTAEKAVPKIKATTPAAKAPAAPKHADAAKVPAKPVEPVPAKRAATGRGGGPVGRMQTALAAAVNEETEWKEF